MANADGPKLNGHRHSSVLGQEREMTSTQGLNVSNLMNPWHERLLTPQGICDRSYWTVLLARGPRGRDLWGQNSPKSSRMIPTSPRGTEKGIVACSSRPILCSSKNADRTIEKFAYHSGSLGPYTNVISFVETAIKKSTLSHKNGSGECACYDAAHPHGLFSCWSWGISIPT